VSFHALSQQPPTDAASGNKSRIIIFNSLFWKPYDARFHDVLESMQHHQELLKMELSMYGHQTTHAKLAEECEELKKGLRRISDTAMVEQCQRQEVGNRIGDLTVKLAETANKINIIDNKLGKVESSMCARPETISNEISKKLGSEMRGIDCF
jgi:uncharacterized phage infection (PIP) family protein YhgE